MKGHSVFLLNCLYEVFNLLKSRIGALLKVSKYRREYIQKELGISTNTMTNWVTGRTYPTIDRAFRLAELLECDIHDLYEKSPTQNNE